MLGTGLSKLNVGGTGKGIAGRALAWVLVFSLLAVCARAQQQDERNKATSFIDSMAQTVYAMAWPTATYKSVSIDGFEPADGGFNVIVKLSGLSGFDQSDLWVKLAFLFRSGGLQDVQVRDNNAILVQPFTTMKLLGGVVATLAQDYNKENNQGANPNGEPAPVPADAAPGPDNPTPAGSSDSGTPQLVAPVPGTDSNNPNQPPVSASAVASDIRAYLTASGNGFLSFTSGDPTTTPQGYREWALNPPTGATTISCVPVQTTQTAVACPFFEAARTDVDAMALGVMGELDGNLPTGWALERQTGFDTDPQGRYAYLTGPGAAWGVIRATQADAQGNYWVDFVLEFPQPQQ
jgi:hypothetical protein